MFPLSTRTFSSSSLTFKIPILEHIETLNEKFSLSTVDSSNFFLLYSRIPRSNCVSKHTTSFLDNCVDSTSESNLRRQPRNRYNLETISFFLLLPLLLLQALIFVSDTTLKLALLNLSPLIAISPPLVLTMLFSNDLHIVFFTHSGHLFSRPTSQNPCVLSSDSHLLNIDLTTDQYATPNTPNRVNYPFIVNITLVNTCQDPRFLYLATH